MIGASPVTVTDSFKPCTCIVMLRVISVPVVSVIAGTSAGPKPASSAFSSYRPGGSAARRKRPSPSVTTVRDKARLRVPRGDRHAREARLPARR